MSYRSVLRLAFARQVMVVRGGSASDAATAHELASLGAPGWSWLGRKAEKL